MNPKELIKAIVALNKGKHETLDIQYSIPRVYWNPADDQGWQKYKKARWLLHSYPKTERILKKLKII